MFQNFTFSFQSVREILLVGHRQAFAWIDDWYGMTMDDVREYEKEMQVCLPRGRPFMTTPLKGFHL